MSSKDNNFEETKEIKIDFDYKNNKSTDSETRKFDSPGAAKGSPRASSVQKTPLEKCEERSAVKSYTTLSMLWKILRPFFIFAVSAGLIIYLGWTAYNFIENNYFAPVNTDSPTAKTIEIKSGSSLSTIATKLHDEGIVRNKLVFQLYVDLKRHGLQAYRRDL